VRGVYVAGHFTNARHIKAAIDVPRKIVPLIAQSLLGVRLQALKLPASIPLKALLETIWLPSAR